MKKRHLERFCLVVVTCIYILILGVTLNILMRLSEIEKQSKEQNTMLRAILSAMALNIDDTEDMLSEPFDDEEGLMDLCEKLTEKGYRKKMVGILDLFSVKLFFK